MFYITKPHVVRSRVSEAIFRTYLFHKSADLTAVQIALLSVYKMRLQPQHREPLSRLFARTHGRGV